MKTFALAMVGILSALSALADENDLRRSDLPTLRAYDVTVIAFIRAADSVFVSLSRNQGSLKTYQVKIGKRTQIEGDAKSNLDALFTSPANFTGERRPPDAKTSGTFTKEEQDQAVKDLENYLAGAKPPTGSGDSYTPASRESVCLLWVKGDEILSISVDRFGLEGNFGWADGHIGREVSDEFSESGEKAFVQWTRDHPAKPIGPDAEMVGPGAKSP